MSQIEPGSRIEMLLQGILNGDTTTNIEPGSRVEAYLKAILENGGGGGGGGSDLPDVTEADIGKLLRVLEGGVWGADGGDDLARIDGYYESMAVGHAEQLLSTVGNTDSEPYLFRPTGGSADVGTRKNVKKIVGTSVIWNQGCDPTTVVSFTTTSYGPATALPVGTRVISGHKYLFGAVGKNYNSITGSVQHPNSILTQIYTKYNGTNVVIASLYAPEGESYGIFSAAYTGTSTGATTGEGGLWLYSALQPNDRGTGTAELTNYQLFDLTQMFGGDTADAIAAMETAVAGAGVKFFRDLFPKIYANNAGELISAAPTAVIDTGFNAWDEVWELGGISQTTGENSSSTDKFRSKNYIHVIPNQTYKIERDTTEWIVCRYYDANKNFIGVLDANNKGDLRTDGLGDTTDARKMPSNCHYFRFAVTNRTTYSNNICIHLRWSGYRDGEYEAYKARTYSLDSSLTLRGLLKFDNEGNPYCDGDVYYPDGTVIRNFETRAYASGDESLPDAITDGTNTVVKLTTPTSEQADTYSELMACDDFGTEEFVDERTVAVPVGHETFYQANLRDKIQHLPDLPGSDGDYIVRVSGTQMTLVPLPGAFPELPAEDGNYNLKLSVADGTATMEWEAIS